MRTALLFFLFMSSAHAEFFNGPISKSLGGGGRAGLPGMESAFLNPALIPLVQSSEMNGYFHDGPIASGAHRNAYGLGLIDAEKDVYFPGAAHYLRLRDTGRAPRAANGELWHIAIGKNVTDWLALGLSGYRLKYELDGGAESTQWNYSFGGLVIINESFGVAYVVDNIAKPGSSVPKGLREDTRQGVGVYGNVAEIAKIRADVSRSERFNPDHKMVYSLGLESMMSKWFVFRMGYRRNDLADGRFWTTGFGFNGPRLKLDYAFEKNQEGTGGAVHSVDLRVPF